MRILRVIMAFAMFPIYSFALLKWPQLFGFDASSLWMFPLFLVVASFVGRILGIWLKSSPEHSKKPIHHILVYLAHERDSYSAGRLLKATVMGMEDIIFVFPLFFVDGVAFNIALVISSILFGLNHRHYPLSIRLSLMAYVPFSYMVGKEFGLLTCVLGHSLADTLVYVSRVLANRILIRHFELRSKNPSK